MERDGGQRKDALRFVAEQMIASCWLDATRSQKQGPDIVACALGHTTGGVCDADVEVFLFCDTNQS